LTQAIESVAVKPKPGVSPAAQADRSQVVGVLVDPGAADAGSPGEFRGVDQRSGRGVVGIGAE
jgi:hypothetical protein